MPELYRFLAILTVDWRERVRSPRFWLILAATAGLTWLCFPSASANYLVLGINMRHRGVYSSAWIGMVLAMLSIWTSLIGFYLVRGSMTRDFDTRVWELLEVTPMSRLTWLAAKWCGNFAVLLAILGVQLAVGLAAQLWRAEDMHVQPVAMLMPVLLIGIPTIAMTAIFALWFDLLPPLRRTLGNYLYFLLWIAIPISMVRSFEAVPLHGWISDPYGITIFQHLVHERLTGQMAAPMSGCGVCGLGARQLVTFDWAPWSMPAAQLLGRAAWLLLPLLGALLAAPVLDRVGHIQRRSAQAAAPQWAMRWPAAVTRALHRTRFGVLLDAELKLALHGRKVWWWLVILTVMTMQAVLEPTHAANALLGAWVLMAPVCAWAVLREAESRAAALVFCAPRAVPRLLHARWSALVILLQAVTLPAIVHFAVIMPAVALAVVLVNISIATWSLVIGSVLRSARASEMVLFVFAYLGLQGVAVLNVAVAPWWTVGLHGALLPFALLLTWLAWPRMVDGMVSS